MCCVLCCRRRCSTVCYSNADAWISHTRIGAFPGHQILAADFRTCVFVAIFSQNPRRTCHAPPAPPPLMMIYAGACVHMCVCVCLLGEVGCLSFGYNIKRLSVSELNFSAASCVVFGFGVVCRVGGDMLCAYHL